MTRSATDQQTPAKWPPRPTLQGSRGRPVIRDDLTPYIPSRDASLISGTFQAKRPLGPPACDALLGLGDALLFATEPPHTFSPCDKCLGNRFITNAAFSGRLPLAEPPCGMFTWEQEVAWHPHVAPIRTNTFAAGRVIGIRVSLGHLVRDNCWRSGHDRSSGIVK